MSKVLQREAKAPPGVRLLKAPPPGFDLLNASDRDLLGHGLPRRPDPLTHPRLAAQWRSHAKSRLQFVTPEFRVDQRIARSKVIIRPGDILPGVSIFDTTNNWSGAFVSRPADEPINVVYGRWNVPSVSPPPSAWNGNGYNDGTYECAVWVGIDGYQGTADVMQAGIAAQVTVSNGISTPTYWAWTEWFGAPPITLTNFPVNPGDVIGCTVCAPFANNHGAASFLNITTGLAMSFPIDPPTNVTLSGNVAEWVVEDPGLAGGGLFAFPNYGSTVFLGCSAGTKDHELDLRNGTPIALVDSSGNTLSTGQIESASTLVCFYGK